MKHHDFNHDERRITGNESLYLKLTRIGIHVGYLEKQTYARLGDNSVNVQAIENQACFENDYKTDWV